MTFQDATSSGECYSFILLHSHTGVCLPHTLPSQIKCPGLIRYHVELNYFLIKQHYCVEMIVMLFRWMEGSYIYPISCVQSEWSHGKTYIPSEMYSPIAKILSQKAWSGLSPRRNPVHLRLWGLSFSVLGDVANWDSGQTQSPSSLGPKVQIQTRSLKNAFWDLLLNVHFNWNIL